MHSKFLGSDKTLCAAILWLLVFHLMPAPKHESSNFVGRDKGPLQGLED